MEYHTPVQAEQGTENSELVVVSVPAHLNTTPHQCTDQHLWSSELVITHLTRHSTAVDQQPHPPDHTHQCMLVWGQGNKMVYYQLSKPLWQYQNTVCGYHSNYLYHAVLKKWVCVLDVSFIHVMTMS